MDDAAVGRAAPTARSVPGEARRRRLGTIWVLEKNARNSQLDSQIYATYVWTQPPVLYPSCPEFFFLGRVRRAAPLVGVCDI